MVGAEFFQPRCLFVAAGACDDRGARDLGKLKAAHSDTSRGTQNQDFLASLDLSVAYHHPAGRSVSHRQGGSLLEAHGIRNTNELVRAYATAFSQASVDRLADKAALNSIDRVDQNAIADTPASDISSQLENLARDVEAHDQRHLQLDSRHAAPRED